MLQETKATVEIDLNDSAFLAELVKSYLDKNSYRMYDEGVNHLTNLVKQLTPQAGC